MTGWFGLALLEVRDALDNSNSNVFSLEPAEYVARDLGHHSF